MIPPTTKGLVVEELAYCRRYLFAEGVGCDEIKKAIRVAEIEGEIIRLNRNWVDGKVLDWDFTNTLLKLLADHAEATKP